MINTHLKQLKLRQHLARRSEDDDIARLFDGILVALEGDAQELLEMIRQSHPSFTRHNLQHSWTIIQRIGEILSDRALESMSSVEIFSLIIAAAFHDVGMIMDTTSDRMAHNLESRKFVEDYLKKRLALISEYVTPLARNIGFIVEAHTLTWNELFNRNEFNNVTRVANQILRVNMLTMLLRIGDLLDLDSDRSSDVVRKYCTSFFEDPETILHHQRHKDVIQFNYDSKEIQVVVKSHNREEHQIWSEWFRFLEQDIEKANTYIFVQDLSIFHLPKPNLEIQKSPDANYDLWALRFELDEQGRIWDVISASIYTGKFDFLREIIQNAIDANLMWFYRNPQFPANHLSPRGWDFGQNNPHVLVSYSESSRTLEIRDNGIGMTKDSLQSFLFKVANTGYLGRSEGRNFPFPSIAQFGLGFISVLTRADQVVIETKPRVFPDSNPSTTSIGRRVTLNTSSQEAFVEQASIPDFGTNLKLTLNHTLTAQEIQEFIRSTFACPSVPILYLDIDGLSKIIQVARKESIDISMDLEHLTTIGGWTKISSSIKDIEKSLSAILKDLNQQRMETPSKTWLQDLPIPLEYVTSDFDKENINYNNYTVLLNDTFLISHVSKKIGSRQKGWESPGIIWIPVRIENFDLGIEWESMHGFIFSKRKIENTICRFVGAENSLILNDDEWLEAEGGYKDSEVLDLVDMFARDHKISEFNRVETEVLTTFQKSIGYSESGRANPYVRMTSEDGFEEFFWEYRSWVTDFLQKDNASSKARNRAKIRHETIYFELLTLIQALGNNVFQDGIKLPIDASIITPIGACRAKTNLTANSRLQLNVARNAIDESPKLLEKWARTIGKTIQMEAFKQILPVLDRSGLVYSIDKLLPIKSVQSNQDLFNYTSRIVRTSFDQVKYPTSRANLDM